MVSRITLVVATLLLLGAGPATAANRISLEEVAGSSGGTLLIGSTVEFRLRFQVDPSLIGEVAAFANGFRIYSPDGATWGTIVHDTLPAWGSGTGWDGGFVMGSSSLDGTGADTMTYFGFRIFGIGAPPGFNEVSWVISLEIPSDLTLIGKTICLDSLQRSGQSDYWLWSDGGANPVIPEWDGPHCFSIGGCALAAVDSVHYDAESSSDFFGGSVAGGMDFDHDHVPDYLVGAPGFDGGAGPSTGRVYLYSGATGALIRHFTGADGDQHGTAVDMAPDMSGSGYPQIIVGTPNYQDGSGIRRGRTYVYDFNGSTWSFHFTVTGAVAGDRLGHSVSSGDFDGDGIEDVASGAPYSELVSYRAGAVYINSGSNGGNLAIIPSSWADSSAVAGTDVDLGGDWDADGKADLLTGVPGRYSGPGTGGWMITRHKPDASLETLSFTADGRAGIAVAWIGNLDGAPGDEYIVGMPDYDVPGKGIVGRVEVHGQSLVYRIDGPSLGSDFGHAVAGVGDVDGDGTPDFAVGAPGAGLPGSVYIYSGASGTRIFSRSEPFPRSYGAAIAGTGDLGGACPPDLLVGAYGDPGTAGTASLLLLDAGCNVDPICPTCPIVAPGDVTLDGPITSADIIYLVGYVFKGGAAPNPCEASGDVNCNGAVTSADIIYLVAYVFKGGPPPCDVCALIPSVWTCP